MGITLPGLFSAISVGGFVGVLVGMTGIGGGALLMPFLLLGLRMPPLRAVGTDLVYSAVVKSVGAVEHLRIGNVDGAKVRWLALGSIPATALSFVLLARLQYIGAASAVIAPLIGAALLLVALLMAWKTLRPRRSSDAAVEADAGREATTQLPGRWLDGPARARLAIVGAAVGALVALTSVGGGSVLFVALSLGTSLGLRRVIGTELSHAALISLLDAVGHLALGNVELGVAAAMIVGALPGVWLGSRANLRVPERVLRGSIAALLLVAAVQLF